ncbi:MAG: hypothetical protein Q8L35_01880, partial [Actinomycetota bacterium]|nr:hypothetical protein [Actinomycetota bacterium]
TVRSNRNWQLFVRKASDLTGANTGWVIPSAQLTFTSPAQANPVQVQNTDTLVDSGGKTAGSNSAVTYNLNITWNDDPDSYTAEHIYTAVQP